MHLILTALLLSQVAPPFPPKQSAAPTPGAIELLRFVPEMASPALVHGTLVAGVRWRDANGENLVVLSRKVATRPYREEDTSAEQEHVSVIELQALHAVRSGGRERQVRRVWDTSGGCGFDNNTRFLKDSLEVTDLDRDGKGEVLFAYFLQCTSDVSPATLKLLLLEDGEKYILRGENRVQLGEDDWVGEGKATVDPSFEKGPRVFREHALARWEAFKTRPSWDAE